MLNKIFVSLTVREQKGKYKCTQLQSAKKTHDKYLPPPTHCL